MTVRAIRARAARQAGFSLIEALVALALAAFIMSVVAVVAGQWLPRWRYGFDKLERAELVGLALDRVAADLAAAQFVTPIGGSGALFYGAEKSVTFTRSPLGPAPAGAGPERLEIVRYAADDDGLKRSRAGFTPKTGVSANSDDFEFEDSSLLLRPPLEVSFGYAGPDRAWADQWSNPTSLPTAVRITVRDGAGEVAAASTAVLLHVEAPACVIGGDANCLGAQPKDDKSGGQPADAERSPGSGAPRGATL